MAEYELISAKMISPSPESCKYVNSIRGCRSERARAEQTLSERREGRAPPLPVAAHIVGCGNSNKNHESRPGNVPPAVGRCRHFDTLTDSRFLHRNAIGRVPRLFCGCGSRSGRWVREADKNVSVKNSITCSANYVSTADLSACAFDFYYRDGTE
ncbi:hypothetical protein EVAR_35444_1 [Eumeta japonica]|uniref:Uncharacterized protein n=1 Tax=Eumeta variegata TaxID=151549 RepID=A0A4C1Z3K2_EUMVA|nr:hypothetical protein EVAR_35444_1 [Eumeta japonica]